MNPHDHYFNLAAASARFDAWWLGRRVDRPPVSLWVETKNTPPLPGAHHATLRDRWLDVDFQVESALAWLETRPALGDSVPSFLPNVGPDLISTLFGAELEFGESTSWCQPTLNETADWERFIQTPPNFDNLYWQTIEQMIARAAERFAGRFYVAMPDLHGNFDILAGLRGPENLCLDLVDDPDLVRRAVQHASRGYREAFRRMHAQLTALGQPATTWCAYLHHGPAYVPSCDFWCLVSKEVGDDLIAPAIEFEMAPLERSIFHLDGPQALQHLDRTLRLPGLNALQWVYGAGHGRAMDWLPVYRQALGANKSVQILAEDARDALETLQALGPDGLWLTVCTPFPNLDRATEFLDTVHQLSA